VAELHTPGAPPLVEMALGTVCDHGARLAEPGEFTLRAFLAGRIDLTQAEAVLGVIDAHDRRALDIALAQLAGGLAAPLAKLRGDLLDLLADLEAGLDFADEHIEFVTVEEVLHRLNGARCQLQSLAETLWARSSPAESPRVALVGWPNTGKSSLFNALAKCDRSMVSPTTGTTRDYLQASVNLDGLECVLVDTAGIETVADGDGITAAAQSMTKAQDKAADLRILCIDAARPPNEWELGRLREDRQSLVVLTKCDLATIAALDRQAIATSAVTSQGLDELQAAIVSRLSARSPGHAVASTAARCRASVERAVESVTTACRLVEQNSGEELIAAEVRVALDELGKITGAVYTEDVLDRIFSRFCIGK
jgi:tRNA modification GTPase